MTAASTYVLKDHFTGSNFFDNFYFMNATDPSKGYVEYVDQTTAQNLDLYNYHENKNWMYVDNTTIASLPGRKSVRIQSNNVYNQGLFIFDMSHIPWGCGTWPAIWTSGANWPYSGEIGKYIMEGTNLNTFNSMTLHSSANCTMDNVTQVMTGTMTASGCGSSSGCSIRDSRSTAYGHGFNVIGGGVFAMEWLTKGIKIWNFPRTGIPSDIQSGDPDPTSWPTPQADFPFGANCPSTNFKNQYIILNTDFCGWGNQTFTSNGCGSSCQPYVANHPGNFSDAFFTINDIKVYEQQ
ncbi:hypothetical protein K450DRAFT_209938 [Umbelopsis ramanniana AG]|uniref:GH16 domain-containing protein n=1 Tax=Umbelopsis ramanniana AG TaxID=1314678 RepID=A0AAD5EA63_UMBRA|nr:uncharacterized protein K450DRAFT_209938 [Umbelopsis ramanniana AG]KAI8579714.1 hypothetical protein K450DRAFT_209938 [Umbelopsis ramanniana AG]